MVTNIILAMLIQNATLIHADLLQTKYGLTILGLTEYNPIANEFFKNNQWDSCYFLSVAGNITGAYLLSFLDDSLGSSQRFLTIISIAEIIVIGGNDQYTKSGIKFQTIVYAKEF